MRNFLISSSACPIRAYASAGGAKTSMRTWRSSLRWKYLASPLFLNSSSWRKKNHAWKGICVRGDTGTLHRTDPAHSRHRRFAQGQAAPAGGRIQTQISSCHAHLPWKHPRLRDSTGISLSSCLWPRGRPLAICSGCFCLLPSPPAWHPSSGCSDPRSSQLIS